MFDSKLCWSALLTGVLIAALTPAATADISASGPAHYRLHHEARSTLTPEALWQRLVRPELWWSDAHTYSGTAGNLSLTPAAGGLWREDWSGGSVAHGTVLSALPPRLLRMNAPFGPLQGLGAVVIWSIEIKAADAGSTVVFTESATGAPGDQLDQLAVAVDQVKAEAIARLVDPSVSAAPAANR
ncbi:MAG: hypothetical protein AAGG11_02480 [Pseudomonadota bacterium]